VVTHLFITDVVCTEVFLLSGRQFTHYPGFFISDSSIGFKPHEIIGKPYILLVCSVEVAFGEADIVYGIEDIGFAHAIIANEAIHFFRKSEIQLFVIFEISKVDGSEEQCK
jgi:hypothetical protein